MTTARKSLLLCRAAMCFMAALVLSSPCLSSQEKAGDDSKTGSSVINQDIIDFPTIYTPEAAT